MILKFRVWDKRQERYLTTVDGSWYELFPTRKESLEVERAGKQGFLALGYAIQRDDLFTVEQFTGVYDKDNKEIYLGDIVEVNGEQHLIEFRGGGFYCSRSDYNLNTIWFAGGGPKVIISHHQKCLDNGRWYDIQKEELMLKRITS